MQKRLGKRKKKHREKNEKSLSNMKKYTEKNEKKNRMMKTIMFKNFFEF